MSDSELRNLSAVFGEDEDNNPFAHTSGLASLIQSNKPNDDDAENSGVHNDTDAADLRGEPLHDADVNESVDMDDDNESLLLYRSDNDQYKTVHISYESRVTKLLSPGRSVRAQITEASKSNDGMANSLKRYIAYTIKLVAEDAASEEIFTRRRYSDFESLRDVLTRVFPLVIIPPIPPKNYFSLNVLNGLVGSNMSTNGSSGNGHSQLASPESSTTNGAASYSYFNSNHLNKGRLIEHRKRLLSNFLNNCLQISQIRNLEFFAKFLDPSANWSDEIALINSQLPKSVYLLNPENGLKTDPIYADLPLPVSSNPISLPFLSKGKSIARRTSKLLGSGSSTTETAQQAEGTTSPNGAPPEDQGKSANGKIVKTASLDEVNKKIMENFIGLSNDYVELGTVLNYCSLYFTDSSKIKIGKTTEEEDTKVDLVFDKIGLAFDRSYITLNTLIGELETKFSEPLGEAVQYSSIIHSVKKFQERKLRQKDLLDTEVKDKKRELSECMRAEMEATRIEDAINSQVLLKDQKHDLKQQTLPSSGFKSSSKGRYFPSMNSLKKITKYVSDIMDQNPEQTRKQRVVYLQSNIATLEKCQGIMLEDITYIADELQNNLKAFYTRELKTIFKILLSYNGIFITWAKKNIEIWEEIREEIGACEL